MKVRNGFVSNSSSSSFILIGKELSYEQSLEEVKKGNKVLFVGNQLSEGLDVIPDISLEQLEMLICYNSEKYLEDNYNFYLNFIYKKEDFKIKKTEMIKLLNDCTHEDIDIVSLLVDYGSGYDFELDYCPEKYNK